MTDRLERREVRLKRDEVGMVSAVPSAPSAPSRPGARPSPVAAQRPLGDRLSPSAAQRPLGVRPSPSAAQRWLGVRRAMIRKALDAALRGATLDGRDRQFLRRLVHRDNRNSAAVAALLWRARMAGRAEVALTAGQMDIVLTALSDAAVYRTSGADALGCWDCENIPGGRCADHARDDDRASACTELAAQLEAGLAAEPTAAEPLPVGISGFRRRAWMAS